MFSATEINTKERTKTMNYFYDPKEAERVAEARESFSGRLLTDAQFDEAMALTGIIEREIRKTGAFKEKLGDYAYAFARTEQFDAMKAETILRDLFKARTGQSMNQMREALAEREQKLPPKEKSLALEYARAVGTMIQEGDKINFNRAFSHQAQQLAGELRITDAGAKRLMKEEFAAVEDRDLYEVGKELEGQFYKPQIEAEKESRERSRDQKSEGRGAESSPRQRTTNGSGESRGYRPRPRP
jgi:hypothetical protein